MGNYRYINPSWDADVCRDRGSDKRRSFTTLRLATLPLDCRVASCRPERSATVPRYSCSIVGPSSRRGKVGRRIALPSVEVWKRSASPPPSWRCGKGRLRPPFMEVERKGFARPSCDGGGKEGLRPAFNEQKNADIGAATGFRARDGAAPIRRRGKEALHPLVTGLATTLVDGHVCSEYAEPRASASTSPPRLPHSFRAHIGGRGKASRWEALFQLLGEFNSYFYISFRQERSTPPPMQWRATLLRFGEQKKTSSKSASKNARKSAL